MPLETRMPIESGFPQAPMSSKELLERLKTYFSYGLPGGTEINAEITNWVLNAQAKVNHLQDVLDLIRKSLQKLGVEVGLASDSLGADLDYVAAWAITKLDAYRAHLRFDQVQADQLYETLPDHVKARVPQNYTLDDVITHTAVTLLEYNARTPMALFDKLPENTVDGPFTKEDLEAQEEEYLAEYAGSGRPMPQTEAESDTLYEKCKNQGEDGPMA